MPTTPYAKLLVSRNGGAAQTGPVVCQPGDVIQLSSLTNAQQYTLYQIYGYPKGWATPSGWSQDPTSGIIFFNGLTPPPFTLTSSLWGKWMALLQVENGKTNGLIDLSRTDTSTALTVISPLLGLKDIGTEETNQFQASWINELQDNLRLLNSCVSVSVFGEIYTIAADSASSSLPSAGTPVELNFAHAGTVSANTTSSTTGIALVSEPTAGQPVYVSAEVAFVEPGTTTQINFVIYHNGVAMPNTLRPTKEAAGALVTVRMQGTTLAFSGDVFNVYAYTTGAGGTTTLAISNANLIVQNVGSTQGPVGPVGPTGSATPYYVNGAGSAGRFASGSTLPTGNLNIAADLSAGNVVLYLQPGAADTEKKVFTIDAQNADASNTLTVISSTSSGASTIKNIVDAAQSPPQTIETFVSGPVSTKREMNWQALSPSAAGTGGWFTG